MTATELVVDLGSTDTRGRAGVVWSLPHGGDLDANLVHLDPDGAIASHVNDEVDVEISVIAGRGDPLGITRRPTDRGVT